MACNKWFFVLMLLTLVVGGCTRTPHNASHNAVGFERMAHPELLPYLLPDGTVTKQFAAYDLTSRNADGNFVNAFIMYRQPNNEVVIFDEYGPGCLYRQQINIWLENFHLYKDAGKSRIRYYFDNEKAPRIDMTADEFFGGTIAPYNAPLCFKDDIKLKVPPSVFDQRFANMYYPLPFEKRLKVTVTPTEDWSKRWCTWYQYTYLAFPTADGVRTWTGPKENSSAVRRQWLNLGCDPKPSEGNISFDSQNTILPGQTETVFDHIGRGSIAVLKFKLDPFDQDTFFNTNILIYWDNQPSASISLPIGYLFGGGGKDFSYASKISSKSLKNLFYGFDSNAHTFYCYWPMPFWSHAKIEIQNQSKSRIALSTYIELKDSKHISYPKDEAGYFCAQRTQDHDVNGTGAFCKVFNERGRGHVVGISFFTDHYAMDGDEFTYIDSSRTPQIHGSGTEDDHDQGWGGSAYQMPLWGGLISGFEGAYRIYMNEPYIFYDNIKINYEYSRDGGTKESRSDVVFFYYKSPFGGGLKLTDEVDVGNESSERSHNYSITSQTWEKTITSCYDGYEKKRDYDCITDGGRAFNGSSEFTVMLDPHNNGVKLRKRVSRFDNGLQTATVYVDGKKVTQRPWHIVQPSTAPADQAWLDSDFQIPASYTHGKKSIKIRMEYAGSAKDEINEFYYWVFCHQDRKQ